METIPLADAQTRIVELIDRVRTTGEPITLTDHGRPVVDLAPTRADEPAKKMTKAEAIKTVEALWKELPPAPEGESRRLVEEGRDRRPLLTRRTADRGATRGTASSTMTKPQLHEPDPGGLSPADAFHD